MNKDILLLGYAREKSTRVKNKMTRQFGDTSLYDIYLSKLEKIKERENPFSDIIMAISPSDTELWSKSLDSKIKIVKRNKYSVESGISNDCRKVYHYLEDFNQEYVMWINGCFPFLKVDTILDIAKFFIGSKIDGLHCVKRRYTWFWDYKKRTIVNKENAGKISTVYFNPTLESVHCIHIYKRKYLLENNSYWKFVRNDPYLYEVDDNIEFLDIDNDVEFRLCEEIYKSRIND